MQGRKSSGTGHQYSCSGSVFFSAVQSTSALLAEITLLIQMAKEHRHHSQFSVTWLIRVELA